MNRYLSYILGSILGIAFYACSGAEETEGVSAASGFQITLVQEESVGEVRKTPAEIGEPAATQFHLKIVNDATQKAVYDAAYKSGFIAAGQGVYTVTATCGTDAVLAIDAPYYKGVTTDVEVPEKSSLPVTVTVACRVANALASVFVEEEDRQKFANLYTDYWVEVAVGTSSASLRPDGKSAYYQSGTLPSFTFKGILKANGQQVSKLLEADALSDAANFAAGQHIRITLGYQPTVPGLLPSIEKVAVETVTVSQTLPVEWLPAPKIGGFNHTTATTLSYTETEDAVQAVIPVTAAMPIQEVEFTIDFNDENLRSLNGSYTLSSMTDAQKAQFNQAQILLPTLNTKETNFNFSQMTSSLLSDPYAETVNNAVGIRVMANNKWSSDSPATYTIQTSKPKFQVTVDERNCWTKEFTIDEITMATGAKGNLTKLKSNVVYQYSADNGATWINCNQSTKQQFTEHPAVKTYRVRALYRGVLPSSTAALTLESPEQLPNSDMEEWSDETYKSSYYSFNPWSSNGSHFWDTNNIFTTRHRYNSAANAANYNGFCAVSYTLGRTGYAAELRSTANGRGNTRTIFGHTEQNYNKVAGELYTGTSSIEMKNLSVGGDANGGNDIYSKSKDAAFSNRPTAIKFWYEYLPYGSDSWNVYVELLDADKNLIISKEYTSSGQINDWTECTEVAFPFDDNMTYNKCKYIYVIFSSTTQPGANMPYREITQTVYRGIESSITTYTYFPAYVGSVLRIDDISLVYDK